MIVSYNKLKTFEECALKYRLTYVERLPRPPIASLAFQRRIHAALAQYHFYAKRDGVVRWEELQAAYDDLWSAREHPEVRAGAAYREGEEILRRYCERENRLGRVPAFLEHTLRVSFGPYILLGKADRIDFTPTGYVLIDYKLDRQLPAGNAAETDRQLSFYHLLLWEKMGVASEEVRLYFLRHGVEQVAFRTRRDLQETVAWADAAAAAIQRERRWEPKEGSACRTCPFQKVCPAKTGIERPLQPVWQQGELPLFHP